MYNLTQDRRKFDRRGKVDRKVEVANLTVQARNRRTNERRQDKRPLTAFPYLPFCDL